MAGIKKLRKIQLGRESTAGTECDATTLWRGTGTVDEGITVEFPDEDVGYLWPVNRSYIPMVHPTLELDPVPCTFEQILHLGEMGIMTATPSTAGGGNAYTYAFPETAAATIKTYTVECGDNQQEKQMLYSYCENITLSGTAGEAVMMGGTIRGRQVATGTYTTGVSIPTVETVLTSKGILYIDAVSGNFFGTSVANTFLGFDFNYRTGLTAKFTGEGAIYYSYVAGDAPEATLAITFEYDGNAATEEAAWRAETGRLIALSFTGATLDTTGTAYTYKTLRLACAGKWESFDKLDERDGNDIVTGTLRVNFDPTESDVGYIVAVNNSASVP